MNKPSYKVVSEEEYAKREKRLDKILKSNFIKEVNKERGGDKKMKLCYLADGRSIHTKRWIQYFVNTHEIELITLDYNEDDKMTISIKDYEDMGVKVHKIKRGVSSLVSSPFKIRTLIKKIQPDIIHSFFVTHYGFLGACSGFHPLVVSPWGSDIGRDITNSKMFRFTVKYALKHADLIQCMDESFVTRIKDLVGDRQSIQLIKEGIDTTMFASSKNNNENGKIRILCLRKIQSPYNVELLIQTIPKIVKVHKNVEFVLLYNGKDLLKAIATIDILRINRYVKFIDVMSNDKVATILNDCDIYVDTFYNETSGSGIGKTALEAMSCELPVVLSNTNGIELHIKHNENGYIYTGGDSDSLAIAINDLIGQLGNSDLRAEIGKHARKYVVEHQDFNNNMKIMEKRYERLMK